ncbi:MAG TPA: hypothetical protein VFA26_11740 [Gemmataceae bacterium]|nr:hypothetical protein [Gemmataceae bacterium]
MAKKIAIAVVAVAAGLLVLGFTTAGRKACSLARLGWHRVEVGADEMIPPEVEIERLRNELAQMGPEMKKHLGKMAEEMVAVENLKKDIAEHRAELDKQRQAIAVMQKELKSGEKVIEINGKTFPRHRIENKLVGDWETFKRSEALLRNKEQLLEQKEQGLETAREQLKAMEEAKEQLKLELAQLETEVKAMRVAEARDKMHFDDSRLGRVKEDVAKLKNRIKTKIQKDELVRKYTADPGVEINKKVKAEETLKEIDAYFSKGAEKEVKK